MAIAAAGLLAGTACRYGPPFSAALVGATTDAAGHVTVRLSLCPGDAVLWVTVAEALPDDAPAGQPQPVLWRVVADEPVALDSVRLGEVPPGFREEVTWTPPPPERAVAATVRTRRVSSPYVTFRPADLRAGLVLAQVEPGDKRLLTDEEFRESARSPC